MRSILWAGLVAAVMTSGPARAADPMPVILDTDMGNDIDDPFALAVLHGLADRGECTILAVTTSKPHPLSAPMCDAINTAYGRPGIPVGAVRAKKPTGGGPYMTKVLGADAREKFPHGLEDGKNAPEAVSLLRKTLAIQADRSAVLVCIGFSTNMAALLRSPGDAASPLDGRSLVEKKVARLVMMAGKFDGSKPEYNVEMDIAAARTVFADWPTPVVLSPSEVGFRLQYPGDPKFEAPPSPEAKRLMMALDVATFGRPNGFPGWDLSAALYAVRPDRGYFRLSKPGTVSVDEKGVTTLKPSDGDRHRYLIVDPDRGKAVTAAYRDLAERKPAER
jgi:inosine-uridine nucleoside N-ribohydrolase